MSRKENAELEFNDTKIRETIINRVQLETDMINQNNMKKYVILIEKNKESWIFYPEGYVE